MEEIVPVIAGIYEKFFPEVEAARDEVIAVMMKEEKAFRQTLRKGIKEFSKLSTDGLTGEEIFRLYDTYGFPVELSVEEAAKRGITIPDDWREQFEAQMQHQRELSQAATKKNKF